MPVGAAGPSSPGTETTSDCATPLPSYRVESPLPLSATQEKPAGLKTSPQGLTRLGSVWAAGTKPSETRLVCWYPVAANAFVAAASRTIPNSVETFLRMVFLGEIKIQTTTQAAAKSRRVGSIRKRDLA